jgi:hypothetical protein
LAAKLASDSEGRSVKIFILAIGVLCVLLGLHWIGQGTLLFPWPSNPAMDGHSEFVLYRIVAACIGMGVIGFARRRF